MIRSIIFVLLLGLTSLNFQDNDHIVWKSDYKLSWNDFLGKPIQNKPASASTQSGVYFELSYNSGILKIFTGTFFDKKKSWVKKTDTTALLLQHEQLHFDISELFARKLRKSILEKKFKSNYTEKKFLSLYQAIINKLKEQQTMYDLETEHNKNQLKQQEWNEKVAKELFELKQYENPYFEIKIK